MVIVPTYNERESLPGVIERLFDACKESVHLLVVDDGSPDGTARLVEQAGERYPGQVHLLERSGKQGLGTAYLTGFEWALERGYPAVVEMDADGSHDPGVVPRLLDALDGADLAIGSRYVPGGDIENWSRLRQALSGFGNLYARLWLGFGVKDSTSGFRAYSAAILERKHFRKNLRSEGYSFQIEMTRRVHKAGGRITEIPITFVERAAGRSKMSRRIVFEALYSVTGWGIRDRFMRFRDKPGWGKPRT